MKRVEFVSAGYVAADTFVAVQGKVLEVDGVGPDGKEFRLLILLPGTEMSVMGIEEVRELCPHIPLEELRAKVAG